MTRRTRHRAQGFTGRQCSEALRVLLAVRLSRPLLNTGRVAGTSSPARTLAGRFTISGKQFPHGKEAWGTKKYKYKTCPGAVLCTGSGSATSSHDPG